MTTIPTIETSDLSLLSKKQQILIVNQRCYDLTQGTKRAIREAKLNVYLDGSSKSDNPHSLTFSDIEQVIRSMAHIGFKKGPKNGKGVTPNITPKLAWQKLCAAENKHFDWVQSVKHRKYDDLVERVLTSLRGDKTDKKVETFLVLFKDHYVQFDGTINQTINNIYEQANRGNEFQLLTKKVDELTKKLSKLESKLHLKEVELERLKTKGNIPQKLTRKHDVIKLRNEGYTIQEIVEATGISKSTVLRDLKQIGLKG